MSQAINIGGIIADLQLDSKHLERGLANARTAIDACRGEVRQLQGDFHRGSLTATDLRDRVAALNTTVNRLTAAMNAAYGATQNLHTGLEIVNANATNLTSISSRMGQSLMQLGYIADDIQYGFSGVVNNIAPLVAGMTGSAGIATAVQVVAVGAYQLYEHWGQLMDAFGVGIPAPTLQGLEGLKQSPKDIETEMEEIRKNPRIDISAKLQYEEDQKRAAGLKAAIEEESGIEKMDSRSKDDRARASAYENAVAEQGGPDRVREALTDFYKDQAEGEEGTNLDDASVYKMLRDKGFDLYTPGGMDRRKVSDLGGLLVIDFDVDAMQDVVDQKGTPFEKQIQAQLRSQRFLHDESSGEFLTPGAMARRTMHRGGTLGDKKAAEMTRFALDEKLGDPNNFESSTFSREFDEASPEGKAEAKANEEAAKAAKKAAEAKKREDEKAAQAQAKREREQEAEEKRIATAMAKGPLGRAGIAGTLGLGDVQGALKAGGMQQADIDKLATGVLISLQEQSAEKIQAHGLDKGIFGEGATRNSLLEEERRKDAREAVTERNRRISVAEEAIPGLDKMSTDLALQARIMGGGPQVMAQAFSQIKAALSKAGIADADLDQTARDVLGKGDAEAQEKITQEILDGPEAVERRKSEVFDAADLTRQIQASVGGGNDYAKKQTDYQHQMVQLLASIYGQQGRGSSLRR